VSEFLECFVALDLEAASLTVVAVTALGYRCSGELA
jgi:hypothetical protein